MSDGSIHQQHFTNEHSNNSETQNAFTLPLTFTQYRDQDVSSVRSGNTLLNDDNEENTQNPLRIQDASYISTLSTSNSYLENASTGVSSSIHTDAYSRLSRTVRSFLNATSSANSLNGETLNDSNFMNSESTMSASSSSYSLLSSEMQNKDAASYKQKQTSSRLSFRPETKEFSILKAKLNHLKNAKTNPIENTVSLYKFAQLMSNHESYYAIMTTPMESNFSTFNSTSHIKTNLEQINSFKKKKHNSCDETEFDQNSDVIIQLTTQIDNELREFETCNFESIKKREFHLCRLCSHCLVEPITLVCGCTFCKKCLKELNNACYSSQQKISLFDLTDSDLSVANVSVLKRKFNQCTKRSQIDWYKCYSCGKEHDHNSLTHLKPNVLLSDLVDKFWMKNIENRKLRNDIRNYICFCLEHNMHDFDVSKFEYMLKDAYNQDPSNHLLLADLFLLTYFNESSDKCIRYAEMVCELRPEWAFVRIF